MRHSLAAANPLSSLKPVFRPVLIDPGILDDSLLRRLGLSDGLQASFQCPPVFVAVTIHSVNRRGHASVHSAIQRFIAIARLLPFGATVTLYHSRHELLGSDLLKELFSVLWEVAVARRISFAAFGGRPIQPQPAE